MTKTAARTASSTSNPRVYTRRDGIVERAMQHAVDFDLVSADSSDADKIHSLVAWADERLVAEQEREHKLAAYRALAADEERRESIRQASFAALENGVL